MMDLLSIFGPKWCILADSNGGIQVTWQLWIDDQLDDPATPSRHVPANFVGAKTVDEAIALVKEKGPPSFMDLDCDLGVGGEVKDFIKWLEKNYHDTPPGFNVHSANIVAAPWVTSFMNSWQKVVRDRFRQDLPDIHDVIVESITSD
jgi:hypothetical protein